MEGIVGIRSYVCVTGGGGGTEISIGAGGSPEGSSGLPGGGGVGIGVGFQEEKGERRLEMISSICFSIASFSFRASSCCCSIRCLIHSSICSCWSFSSGGGTDAAFALGGMLMGWDWFAVYAD